MRSLISGVGSHNSEYHRFNRSFGRGYPKAYQRRPSPQPNRRGDLFVEAGRLAVEYLVSHGLLSSNVLSSKFQNGILRNNSAEFQTSHSFLDREISNSYVDERPVLMAPQRAASPNGVSGRRKSAIDQDSNMSRNSYSRDRRRHEISRSNSYEWSRENEKDVPLSCRATASEGMEASNDKFPEGKFKDADTDVCDSLPAESAPKDTDDRRSQLPDEKGKSSLHDDSNPKMTSVLPDKEVEELPNHSDEVKETENSSNELNKGEETLAEESVVEHYERDNDSLKLSVHIPTEVHTSLSNRSLSSNLVMLRDSRNASDTGCDLVDSTKDITINGSTEIPPSDDNHGVNFVGMDPPGHSLRDAGFLDPAYASDQKRSVGALFFNDGIFSYEKKTEGLFEPGNCSKDRGEKRPFEGENVEEGAKRAKQWLSVAQSSGHSQLSDPSEKQTISLANRTAPVNFFSDCANQESFTNVSLPLKGSVGSTIEEGEEKQLFSTSFKICDLNLMEGSDMREKHDISGLLHPSISASNKNVDVDVDLSMNNNYSFTSGYNDRGVSRKVIEVIDLETASLQEVRSVDTSTRNMEGDVANMGSFPNNSQNCNDIPDGQDGYGFMIELLGNDVPNCSSVQSDVNSLHNDMGLHHGEGIFSEDDQIYMSLGEIPISLLRGWEQPTQERNPFEM